MTGDNGLEVFSLGPAHGGESFEGAHQVFFQLRGAGLQFLGRFLRLDGFDYATKGQQTVQARRSRFDLALDLRR